MFIADLVLCALIIVTAIILRQVSDNSFAIMPWIYDSNTIILAPPLTLCIGDKTNCRVSSGRASVWQPIILNDSWLIDSTPSGSLRVSTLPSSTPLLYITPTGVVLGPTEIPAAVGIHLRMIPVSDTPTAMWRSRGRLSFSDGSILDSVCHINDATICGSLFRVSTTDDGIFYSPLRTIIGYVDYGLLAANHLARVIVNASIVITQYIDTAKAVPCCCYNYTGIMPPLC